MYLPTFWRRWQEIRKLWWVQALYIIFLLGSYALFAYILSCIWLLETPSILQLFLICLGSMLGAVAIGISFLDCILLCCRRSARVQLDVTEPLPLQLSLQQSSPMLVPRMPLGRRPNILMSSITATTTSEKIGDAIV